MPLVLLTQVQEKLQNTTGKKPDRPNFDNVIYRSGSAVQHYAQDPATLTQSERDANVKDLTQKALAVRIKLQEQKMQWAKQSQKKKRTSRA